MAPTVSDEHLTRSWRLERCSGQLRSEVPRHRDAVEMRGESFIQSAEMQQLHVGSGNKMRARAAQCGGILDMLGNHGWYWPHEILHVSHPKAAASRLRE